MGDTKPFWMSKVVWSGIIIIIASFVNGAGYVMDEITQTEIVELIMTVITGLAGLVAIVGRIRATKMIGK